MLPFFAPLLLFGLVAPAPHYFARLSLLTHGIPFARVVPKEKLDVFKYVPTDNLRSSAIVFSGDKAVGWILVPWSGFPQYIPFSGTPGFDDFPHPFSGLWLILAWHWRWWLLDLQLIVLLAWLALRQRKAAHAVALTSKHA